MKLVYIAGPFRGATPWDVAENVRDAERMGLAVAESGANLFPVIPHANTALFDKRATDQLWLDGTMLLLERCDAVLLLPTWQKSSGARAENARAFELGIPVFMSLCDLVQWARGTP